MCTQRLLPEKNIAPCLTPSGRKSQLSLLHETTCDFLILQMHLVEVKPSAASYRRSHSQIPPHYTNPLHPQQTLPILGFSLEVHFTKEVEATSGIAHWALAHFHICSKSLLNKLTLQWVKMRADRLARHLVLFRRENLFFKGWNLKVRFLYSLLQFSNVPDKRMFIQSQSLSIFFNINAPFYHLWQHF